MKKLICLFSFILIFSCLIACNGISNDTADKVVVTFDLDGGTIECGSSLTVDLWEDANIPTPTKKGYDFDGWTHNGNFVSLKPWMIDESSVTIKANWRIRTYQVHFDFNGGLLYENENIITKKSLSLTYGDKVELELPKKEGYDFVGWYYGDEKVNDNSFDLDVGRVILKAKWQLKKQLVTLNFNGGEKSNSSNIKQEVIELTHNETFELPTLQKKGYTFGGWAFEDGTLLKSSVWAYDDSVNKLNAVWNATTVGYEFDLKGGTLDELGSKILYGSSTSKIRELAPVKQGYNFNCWKVNGNQLGYTFNYLPEQGNNKVILTADYTPKSYNLTLYAGEGSFANESSKTVSVNYGVETAINIPTAPLGKYFAGYKIQDTDEIVCSSNGNIIWHKTFGAKLIAQYSSSKSISFIHYDGSVDLISLDDISSLREEDVPIAKTTTGYSSYWDLDYRQITTLTEPTEIHAVLTPHSYVVTYRDGTKVVAYRTYTYGESVNLLSGSDVISNGYDLLGWAKSISGSDYISGTVVWDILGNVDLYAVWTNFSYTITYDTSTILTDFSLVDEFGNQVNSVQNVTQNKQYKLYTLKAKNNSLKVTWQYNGEDFLRNGTYLQGKNIVLTPKITYNPIKIDLILDLNGGTGSTSASVTLNNKFSLIKASVTPPAYKTVVAYSYKEKVYFLNDVFDIIDYDGTPIKVIYDAVISFKINIDPNGGDGDNEAIIEYGKALGSMDGRPYAPDGKKLVGFLYNGVEYSLSYVWDFSSYNGGVFKAIYVDDNADWSPTV